MILQCHAGPRYLSIGDKELIIAVGTNFELVKPKGSSQQSYPLRTCIWIDRGCDVVQVPTEHSEILAVKMTVSGRIILLVTDYMQCTGAASVDGTGAAKSTGNIFRSD